MKNLNIVYKGQPNKNFGYLKLAVRQNGKTTITSLNIRIFKKDFNTKTQRVRSSAKPQNLDGATPDEINNILESKILEYANNPIARSKIKCMLQYMQIVINQTVNEGTKQKYQNIYNLFQNFINTEYNKNDLEFDKIDSSVIISFKKYLRQEKIINNRKSKHNSNNTANYKLKSFKGFFSKLENDGIYKYPISPFSRLKKMNWDAVQKDYLTLDEFKKFIKHQPIEYRSNTKRSPVRYSLEDIKESFIFSVLAQGIRISDILTLRINDFEIEEKENHGILEYSIWINKIMFKTKKEITVYLNKISMQYIRKQLIRIIKLDPDIENNEQINNFIKVGQKFERLQDGQENDINDDIFEHLNVETEYFNSSILAILELKKIDKLNNVFIFPFLNNDLFANIVNGDFSMINEKQYLELIGKRSYINLLLKKIFKQANLNKSKLSFHSARHTYTTLVLFDEIPVSVFVLQKSLGHGSVTTTEKYIGDFNRDKFKSVNDSIANRLNSF